MSWGRSLNFGCGRLRHDVNCDPTTDLLKSTAMKFQISHVCFQYKSLYARQQREYYNVLGVATELVEALENAILGNTFARKYWSLIG